MSDIMYELKTPFSYAFQGEQQEAAFIAITAPSVKQLTSFTPIKQAFSSAVNEIASHNTGESQAVASNEKTGGGEVIQLLSVWSGDLSKVYLHAKELFKSGVALIDGETLLTAPLMDKMSLEDFEGLVGEYLANFLVPSLIGK